MTGLASAKSKTGFSRTCAAILGVCITIIVTIWVVTYERIGFEREGDIAEAVKQTVNLAVALEQNTAQTFRGADQTLQFLKMEYEEGGARMSRALLRDISQVDPSLYVFLAIVDANGSVVASNLNVDPFDVSDREYFRHHREVASGKLFIGRSRVGHVSERKVLNVSRRIDDAQGGFAGVVVAGLSVASMNGFYDQVDLGADGMIQLVGLDGMLRARRTGAGAGAAENMKESTLLHRVPEGDTGSFRSTGRVDGVKRYISYRVMREFGLIVSAGMSEQTVLAPSGVRRGWYLLGSSLATLFVVIFGSGLIATLRRQRKAMDAAFAGESLYRVTFEQAAVGIVHTAMNGRILRANARYCDLVGYTEEELRAKTVMDVLHPDDIPSPETMRRVLREGGIREEYRHVRKDGAARSSLTAVSVVRDAAGRPDYFVAMVQDVTERNEAQAKLLHQAHYDLLTGLPNRLLLLDRLGQALSQAQRKGEVVGVLFINLDRFKAVNDSLGRASGDQLLCDAARRIAGILRAGDTVARTGGDEFAVVLPEIGVAKDAGRVARKIIKSMALPFQIDGRDIFVTASIGIAIFPGDGANGETLINNADAAMGRAKQVGRNNHQFYSAGMNEHAAEKLLLESDLRRAIERNEFLLHYQPKLDLATGRVTGVEALLRWKRADGKLVSPGEFIPLLEESGMICGVGDWVIQTACAQIRDWRRAGLTPVPVAVNVSTKQFLRGDLRAIVDQALLANGVEPWLLEIEITESDAMQEQDRVIPVLEALRERGVSIAIDDFGTGYSSLGYLSKLPVQTLKIDRSFVIKMHSESNAMTLVSTIISLAHSLKLKVVAEGVETEDQSSLLRLLHCDQMQGYLFSRPIPAADCVRYLDTADAVRQIEAVAA